MDKRRFHRVKCEATGKLLHHDITYRCRLENISLRGAMLTSDECIMVPLGESCTLSVITEPDTPPLIITVDVVHCFFSMVGVRFAEFAGDAEQRVLELLKRISPEPVKLMQEWEAIEEYKRRGWEEAQQNPQALTSN